MFLDIAEKVVDSVFAWLPRKSLNSEEIQSCRLVAHRGCPNIEFSEVENTLVAFENAFIAGVWGIEFDVQWTRDHVPVVIHDPDTGRISEVPGVEVGEVTFDELRQLVPIVPSLAEVVTLYRKKMHLMIEIKAETATPANIKKLAPILEGLEPATDYHFLALDPKIIEMLSDYPAKCLLLTAITNTSEMFEHAMNCDCGGLTGHYLLLNKSIRQRLASKGLLFGTGHVDSMNLLTREIRLGCQWVFSNAADKLARQLHDD